MIPIENDDYLMLIEVLTDYSATIAAVMESYGENPPEVEAHALLDEDARRDKIEHAETLKLALLERRFVVFDARPRCMVKLDNGDQCDGQGRYQPFAFVHLPNQDQPIAQLAIQPVLRICGKHATSDVSKYISKDAWRDISANTMRQSQQLVQYDDCRLMYMDHGTQTMVPPPAPQIALVSN